MKSGSNIRVDSWVEWDEQRPSAVAYHTGESEGENGEMRKLR